MILTVCLVNRDRFSVDGVLHYSPRNPLPAVLFMLFLFALKSLSVFIFSGILAQVIHSLGRLQVRGMGPGVVDHLPQAVSPHQRQRRRGPLRVHPLLQLQHPGDVPAGLPAGM